ncbi:hypothetical protein [Streptomyces sp. NPDC053048]|uniref:hypothetical protein n=1 Tax=Streptomyces sp. NPDC053048 TaxID=3365694 RepID=UPI0037D4CDC5
MAYSTERPGGRARTVRQSTDVLDVFGQRPSPTRHPLVAAAMVLPLAAFLAVAFGGWDAVVTQASSVAGMLGR